MPGRSWRAGKPCGDGKPEGPDRPPQTVRKVLARLKYSVPLYKARSGFSIFTEEYLTFQTVTPLKRGLGGLKRHHQMPGRVRVFARANTWRTQRPRGASGFGTESQ